MNKLTKEQREVLRQKECLLSGNDVGYTPIPHDIYRKLLPELKAKYDGMTARDCVLLYGYLQAYVNGQNSSTTYMWAYPSVKQISSDTGIHKDRIKPLVDILEKEGVLISKMVSYRGHLKKMYMPLYERKSPDSC
ncbi:helix-turn-helix domain-containing protein [Bacillus chungangensis]|uniref:Helix-turn-helix domain-containing protein n=1 Tax=Bacillus chungangensis TaxID=587633 RepID=A0ABT9WMF3_9BACI|nr:hypothetical protein [Bacillus chungangensis]MDQ0174391.1 hypothetical protein [Bacillus chungangensis]